ncbi:MAG: MFS transporter [Ignavibacteriales bacterium]
MAMRRSTLVMVCMATVYAFSHRMSVVPFYDLFMQEYGITYAQAGGLLSAFFVGYALFIMPAGVLADRLVTRNVLVAGLAVVGTSATAFALARSYTLAMAARFLVGIGIALIHPSAIKILAASFDRKMLGLAVGLRESSAGAGILAAVTAFPLLARTYDPARILLVAGLLWIPIAAGCLWVRPSGGAHQEFKPRLAMDLRVLARREVLLLAGASFFGLFAINGFVGWFPAYLEKGLGMEKAAAGVVMAGNMGAMIVVAMFGGRLSDLMGRRPVAVAGSCGLAIVLALLWLGSGVPPMAMALFAGGVMALSTPPLVTLAAEIVNVENAGAVTGLVTAIGQIASAVAGWFLGWLLDVSGGFSLSWAAMLGSLAVELLLLLNIRERRDGLGRVGA